MSCECYTIGGPWITYDPDCGTHGDEARAREARLVAQIQGLALKTYSIWRDTNGDVELVEGTDVRPKKALLWILHAATWEEAYAIRNLRLGYEPYRPGPPRQCPKCPAFYYPEGSGECCCENVG